MTTTMPDLLSTLTARLVNRQSSSTSGRQVFSMVSTSRTGVEVRFHKTKY